MASEDLTPVIVIVAAIFWTKADEGLTVAEAFTSLSIISIAETPLVNILISIVQLFGAIGCFSRLQAFLIMDERRDLREMAPPTASSTPSTAYRSSITLPPVDDAPKDANPASNIALAALEARARPSLDPSIPAVAIESATFTVGENVKVLADISMVFPRGTVSMIVGRVGCGKSSLLKAIAGELSLAGGRLVANVSSMAYCDQTPWLQNCSIRDNIAAQSPLDEEWLHTVIEACALDEDISMLPARDFTIVGSGGVALSGGQKQRVVSLANIQAQQEIFDVFGNPGPCARGILPAQLAPPRRRIQRPGQHYIQNRLPTRPGQRRPRSAVECDRHHGHEPRCACGCPTKSLGHETDTL